MSHINPFTDHALASGYDGWFETPLGQAVDRLEQALIWRLARPRAGERALDVGTGTGHLAVALAQRGLRVVGYDTSEAMLRVARAKSEAVAWQRGDAAHLPLADASFDLALCVTALEFMADPSRALAEMARVVAPGGRLVVAALNAASPWGVALQREAQEHDTLYRHAHFYTPDEFVAALSRLGRMRWSSAVFFAPNGQGLRHAALLERCGQTFRRGRGALLVGRVER